MKLQSELQFDAETRSHLTAQKCAVAPADEFRPPLESMRCDLTGIILAMIDRSARNKSSSRRRSLLLTSGRCAGRLLPIRGWRGMARPLPLNSGASWRRPAQHRPKFHYEFSR